MSSKSRGVRNRGQNQLLHILSSSSEAIKTKALALSVAAAAEAESRGEGSVDVLLKSIVKTSNSANAGRRVRRKGRPTYRAARGTKPRASLKAQVVAAAGERLVFIENRRDTGSITLRINTNGKVKQFKGSYFETCRQALDHLATNKVGHKPTAHQGSIASPQTATSSAKAKKNVAESVSSQSSQTAARASPDSKRVVSCSSKTPVLQRTELQLE